LLSANDIRDHKTHRTIAVLLVVGSLQVARVNGFETLTHSTIDMIGHQQLITKVHGRELPRWRLRDKLGPNTMSSG
jgi:hypothetical protein